MTDDELIALALKCGIYWVSENTAYMHPGPMRVFADAIAAIERERIAKEQEVGHNEWLEREARQIGLGNPTGDA